MLSILDGRTGSRGRARAAQAVLGGTCDSLSPGGDEIHRNAVAQPLLCAVQVGDLERVARPAADAARVRRLQRRRAGRLCLRRRTRRRGSRGPGPPPCRGHGPGLPGTERPAGGARHRPGSGWRRFVPAPRVEIAIVNDVDRLVVGGRSADLIGFQREVTALGAGITPMMVSIASHTSLLNDAVPGVRASARCQRPPRARRASVGGDRRWSGIQPGSGRSIRCHGRLPETVQVGRLHRELAEMGCTVLLELGPCNGLSRMVRDRYPDLAVRSVAEFRSLQGVVEWVGRQSR